VSGDQNAFYLAVLTRVMIGVGWDRQSLKGGYERPEAVQPCGHDNWAETDYFNERSRSESLWVTCPQKVGPDLELGYCWYHRYRREDDLAETSVTSPITCRYVPSINWFEESFSPASDRILLASRPKAAAYLRAILVPPVKAIRVTRSHLCLVNSLRVPLTYTRRTVAM
jgi:hypothetical protein